MKIRNKKTGEIQTCDMVVISDEQIHTEIASLNKHTFIFRSIEQFNDEYESYTPAEPLIKDEKVRKAIRAWAEVMEIETVEYDDYWQSFRRDNSTICFRDIDDCYFDKLEDNKDYNIAELCGEEEE